MTIRSYDRQHLALWAAGWMNAAGTTQVTFGCELTRIGAGEYGLVLDDDHRLVDDETFTFVTAKASGTDARSPQVVDTSNRLKTIHMFSAVPSAIDTEFEVVLYRPVNR